MYVYIHMYVFIWGVKLLNWKGLSYKTLTIVFFAGLNQCKKMFFFQTELSGKILIHNSNFNCVAVKNFCFSFYCCMDLPIFLLHVCLKRIRPDRKLVGSPGGTPV